MVAWAMLTDQAYCPEWGRDVQPVLKRASPLGRRTIPGVEITRLGPADADKVAPAAHLFDDEPKPEAIDHI